MPTLFQIPKVAKLVMYGSYNLKRWQVGVAWHWYTYSTSPVEYPTSYTFNIYFLCFTVSFLWKYPHDFLRDI